MIDWVLNRGYAAFDSSSGWKTRTQYLKCKVIALPIAYSEQLSHKKKIHLDIEYRFQEYRFYKISFKYQIMNHMNHDHYNVSC